MYRSDSPKAELGIRTWGRGSLSEGDSASRHEKVGRVRQGRRIARLKMEARHLSTSSIPH